MAAVEMHEGQPVRVRFDRVRAFRFEALRAWHAVALAPGTQVTSGGLIGCEVLQLAICDFQLRLQRDRAGQVSGPV